MLSLDIAIKTWHGEQLHSTYYTMYGNIYASVVYETLV